ncbi:nucleotide exchange factor GrpE [Termitidicoccus mucosus]|uniref:nucleotide exchange factor GrpE n=1 Tax=Termitidicoccus mucosus TaxID=1184151 RepID=UPI0009FC2216
MTAPENAEPLKNNNTAADPAASQSAPAPEQPAAAATPAPAPNDTGCQPAKGDAPSSPSSDDTAAASKNPACPGKTQPADAAQSAVLAMAAELATAKKEAADNYDRYVRAVADHENFRRRALREKDEIRLYAASRVLEDLFPIIEALALGINAAKAPGADSATLVNGMTMVLDQFKTALAGHGLKEIHPEGEKFDPNHHEAIATQPSADVPEGNIIQVFRTGYALNGRVLRPAAVIVSSGPAAA